MSTPARNPNPTVCNMIPEGGLQSPFSCRATITPEPLAPDNHNPVRIVVKIANPTAFCITFCGMFFSTLCLPLGTSTVDGRSSSV